MTPRTPNHRHTLLSRTARAVVLCACSLLAALPVQAQDSFSGNPMQTRDLEGAELIRREGNKVPLDLTFRDTSNNTRTLGELFEEDGPPVVLLPVYFDCPIICPMTMNSAGAALSQLRELTPGEDYRLLVLSFDHRDTPRSSSIQRDAFLLKFEALPGKNAIEFWTGDTDNILALTRAVGFGYSFSPNTGHFSHTSAMIFLRNDGTVHNYLPGSVYTAAQVRTGIREAGEGESATIWDQVVLLCRVLDENTGEYKISPMRVMQLVGAVTVVFITGGITLLVVTNRLRERSAL